MNGEPSKAKGTAVLARLHYIEAKWGKSGLDGARGRMASCDGVTSVLSSLWYPSSVLRTLESAARNLGRTYARFSQREMGAAEAQYLMAGPYTHIARKNPREMAAALPILFNCLYSDLKLRCEGTESCRRLFTVDGDGFALQDRETYAGFLMAGLSASGAASPELLPSAEASGRTFSIRWSEQRREGGAERVKVQGEMGIMESRSRARDIGMQMGFGGVDMVGITTCVSELARNIVNYAGEGTITIEDTEGKEGRCIRVRAEDRGPGIPHLDQVMAGLHRSEKGMGMGLRAIKRLADDFSVTTFPGQGTAVEMVKYLRRR